MTETGEEEKKKNVYI